MFNKINEKQISILVHGPVEIKDNLTQKSLQQIRKIFPGSKIILSTWENTDCSGLEYDKLVLNKDPGAEYFNILPNAKDSEKYKGCKEFYINDKLYIVQPKKNNVNRMLTTIKNGLEKVETDFVLKIRTDILLKDKKFLNFWDMYEKYDEKYKIFKHRVINNSIYAQFAHVMKDKIQLLPFHMSDWIHFGYTDDVKLLFSCPLQSDESAYYYWNNRERKQYESFLDAQWQYPPETYILSTLAKKYYPEIEFQDSDDYNKDNMQFSHRIIANNFIMLDDDQLSFTLSKYPKQPDWVDAIYNGFITNLQWKYLYKKCCDKYFYFFDFDYKRLRHKFSNIFNLIFFIKYPKRYVLNILFFLNMSKNRKSFYMEDL